MTTRRDFLKAACGVAAIALGPALLANDAQAATGITRLPDGRVAVTVARIPGLAQNGGTVNLGTVKGTPVAIVRTGSTYRALDLRCTHQGVTVVKEGSAWSCPAHGSQYGIDGTVTAGPAVRSLAVVPSTLKGKQLIVG